MRGRANARVLFVFRNCFFIDDRIYVCFPFPIFVNIILNEFLKNEKFHFYVHLHSYGLYFGFKLVILYLQLICFFFLYLYCY